MFLTKYYTKAASHISLAYKNQWKNPKYKINGRPDNTEYLTSFDSTG